jgi:hypothetical protein
MADLNGVQIELVRFMERMSIHMGQQTDTQDRTADTLEDIRDLQAAQLALMKSSPTSSKPQPHDSTEKLTGLLKAIPPILKASVWPLALLGLIIGRITWADITSLLPFSGH